MQRADEGAHALGREGRRHAVEGEPGRKLAYGGGGRSLGKARKPEDVRARGARRTRAWMEARKGDTIRTRPSDLHRRQMCDSRPRYEKKKKLKQ